MIAALYVQPDGVYAGLPSTRAEAVAIGATRYFTGRPCKNGHISDRDVSSHTCGECLRLRSATWAKANPEKRSETYKKYRLANAVVIAAKKKAWKQDNREKHRASRKRTLIRQFMPIDEFEALLAHQGGCCAICRTEKGFSRGGDGRRLAIDHCHKTGAVRGLLCGNCNRMLGIAQDDPEILRAAAIYLERLKS